MIDIIKDVSGVFFGGQLIYNGQYENFNRNNTNAANNPNSANNNNGNIRWQQFPNVVSGAPSDDNIGNNNQNSSQNNYNPT